MTRLVKSEAFGREGYIPGLGISPDLARDAFNAKVNDWLPVAYALNGGAFWPASRQWLPPAKRAGRPPLRN